MKETTDIVPKIKDAIAKKAPTAVILKHNDYSTVGIPDLSITYLDLNSQRSKTTWVEVKLLKEDETLSSFKKHFSGLQLTQAILLERQGYAYYFVAYPLAGLLCGAIFSPRALKVFLDQNMFDGAASFSACSLIKYNGMFDHALDFISEVVMGRIMREER